MYVVIFKQHGALNCEQQVFGPFDLYTDAEDALSNGEIPVLESVRQPEAETTDRDDGHRYIQELVWVKGCIL